MILRHAGCRRDSLVRSATKAGSPGYSMSYVSQPWATVGSLLGVDFLISGGTPRLPVEPCVACRQIPPIVCGVR